MMDANKLRTSGWITLALAAASLEPILVKFGYRGTLEPAQLVVLKNIVAALVMVPLFSRAKAAGLSSLRQMLIPGVLLFITNVTAFLSLQHLQVVLFITIVTTTPALVALVNTRLGRESGGSKFWLGLFMCFAGVICTLEYKDIAVNYLGVACACISALSSTLYRVKMEDLTSVFSPALCSFSTFAVQAALTLLLIPLVRPLPAEAYGLGLWLGISASIGNIAFLSALQLVGSTRISILTMLQRPLIVVLAAVSLQESISPPQWLGVALVMIGVQMAQVKRVAEEKISGLPC